MYENRTVNPVEIILRRGVEGRRENMERVNLRYIASMYVSIKMYPH
jgi:hypothetical protein